HGPHRLDPGRPRLRLLQRVVDGDDPVATVTVSLQDHVMHARIAARSARLLIVGVLLGACGDNVTVDPDAAVEPDAALPDPTDALFDLDRILDVEIDMAPEDWAALRAQGRDLSTLSEGCLSRPPESPYTYFPARVTIDGAV